MVVDHFRIETLGVLLHAHHQVRTLQAFHITGPVIHFRGGGELATRLDTGDHNRLEVGTGGVDGRSVTRRAGTQNNQPMVLHVAHVLLQ